MASSLHLIISNLATRSVVPTLASASRFLHIDRHVPGHRSYTTMPIDDLYDQSWLKFPCPKISSMSFRMVMFADNSSLSLSIPDEGISVALQKCGLKKKDMKAFTELNEDEFKTNIMANILASDIITSFSDITAKRNWPYYDMFFNRSILGKRFCPLKATSSINSFTIYKEETAYKLDMSMDMPGDENMRLTTRGLRVSLEMPGLERKEEKTYFDYDTFFIEGKTKEEHYITCIHLPEDIQKKHNMIKKHMKDGVFYAIISCRVKKNIKIN